MSRLNRPWSNRPDPNRPASNRPPLTRAVVLATSLVAAAALGGCSLPGGSSGPAPTAPKAGTPAPTSADPANRPELARYYQQKPAWTNCGEGLECTKVTVPVDWAQPSGETIELAVNRRPASGTRIGSLFLNPGGPGVSGVDWLKESSGAYGERLRDSFDLVGWDPRGVGGSAPIECLPNSQLDAYNAIDSTPDDPAEEQTLEQSQRDFYAGCERRTGAVLAHVDTLSTVHDMDVLRAVVGDQTMSYFGASYGTFLGAWYAQTFPWRVGRMVLDGAVDPTSDGQAYAEGQTIGFSRALDAYLKDCLSRQACPLRGSQQDAKDQLGQLLSNADRHPLRTSSGRELVQSLMATGIIQGMYSTNLWSNLNEALTKAFQGDGTGLLALADDYNQRDKDGTYSQALQATGPIFCLDHPETRSLDQIQTDAQALAAKYPPLGGAIAWGAVGCATWPIKPVVMPQRLTAQGAAPILVVGTTGDPATPYEWAKSLAGQLTSGRLLTRQGVGHTAYFPGGTCIRDDIDSYLVSGTLPAVGTVCK